jgi:hypothetical protein
LYSWGLSFYIVLLFTPNPLFKKADDIDTVNQLIIKYKEIFIMAGNLQAISNVIQADKDK